MGSMRRKRRVVPYIENNINGGVRTEFDLPANTQISAPNHDNTFCAPLPPTRLYTMDSMP